MLEDMGDGFVKPITPEEVEQWQRDYDEAQQHGSGPRAPTPPMANVGLALELSTGANAEQQFTLFGQTYHLKPTPYGSAIRLLAWSQKLEQLEALGPLIGEHLLELRDCYRELASIGASLLVERLEPNPFLEAAAVDFHRLVAKALATGDEVPIRSAPSGPTDGVTLHRYNAAHFLYAYLDHFGSVPGMVVIEDGRPCPASWRHFATACTYLRRARAERALDLYGATALAQWGDEKGRSQFVQAQLRETGQA